MYHKIIILIALAVTIIQAKSNRVIEKEIFFNSSDLVLSGTLTLPSSEGKYPCIILISGGYPDTRDADILDFKPFKILSEYFVKQGYATFRYDDRGVGKSEGKHTWQYSALELAGDVIAAYDQICKNPNIDPQNIGVCGHCFGAIISPYVYSKRPEIAFMISLSAMGTTFERQWITYREYSLENIGIPEAEIDSILKYDRGMIWKSKNQNNWKEIKSELLIKVEDEYSKLPEQEKSFYPTFDEYTSLSYYGVFRSMITTPFAQSLWDYSPLPLLEKVNCPILILLGEKDESMPLHIHYDPIKQSLERSENNNYEIHVVRNANHYFTESYEPGMNFVPGFLDHLGNWLEKL